MAEIKEWKIYPVLFMFVLCAVFVGVLAFFYQSTKGRVENYRQTQKMKTVLSLFSLPTDNAAESYRQHISEKSTKDGYVYYQAKSDTLLLGYAFPIYGKGLWSSLEAMLSVSADYQTILGLEIIEQAETPGLGGRITENWFRDQFKGKSLFDGKSVTSFTLIGEDSQTKNNMDIRQITGATLSSSSVLKMITDNYTRILQKLGVEK